MKHVYDWLNEPALNAAEADAKEWLNKFMRPAYINYKDGTKDWLDRYTVFCDWQNVTYICSGASRLGDVWLKNKSSKEYYDRRVDIAECSNWKRIINPIQP